MIYLILLVPAVLVLFRFTNAKNKPAIFGIYQQKNKTYLLKFIFMYLVLKFRQLKDYLTRLPTELRSDGELHVQEHDVSIEKCYDLGDYPKSVDAVYFNGMSETGEALICGLARRPQRTCDAFLYLKLDGEDVLLTPSLPDSYLKKSTDDDDGYDVQGLTITNFIPMRTWKLKYNGEMKRRADDTNKINVEADLTWSATSNPFNYDIQMSACSMANDMAREYWSADYFKLLKKYHQTHYEQVGYMAGTVIVNGKKHEIKMPCMRDHSFGKLREWRNFHRYVYHFIFLDNGDFIAAGSVSQPSILSHLNIGYYWSKVNQSLTPIDSSDFQLYQHAENQIIPKDYAFSFKAGGISYVVKIQDRDEVGFYIGKDREAKFYEKWCDVEVNGLHGRACVEWHYNNVIPK